MAALCQMGDVGMSCKVCHIAMHLISIQEIQSQNVLISYLKLFILDAIDFSLNN